MKKQKKPELLSLTQLRAQLRDVAARAAAGDTFIITSYRRPIIEMRPVEEQK